MAANKLTYLSGLIVLKGHLDVYAADRRTTDFLGSISLELF